MKNSTIKPMGMGLFLTLCLLLSCWGDKHQPSDEELNLSNSETPALPDSLVNSISGSASMSQVATYPSEVILTGLPDHRLISVYKSKKIKSDKERDLFQMYSSDGYGYAEDEHYHHFMPGIDILTGYNLLNIAHYDFKTERLNFLFDRPVLVKTLYFPSQRQDSLDGQPINRDYYLLSAFDEDTNRDSLINRKDLRHFYHFDANGIRKAQIVPPGYAVLRSQYDSGRDLMYIFARKDENQNGEQDPEEPVHVFWMGLKSPGAAKRMY